MIIGMVYTNTRKAVNVGTPNFLGEYDQICCETAIVQPPSF